jgi:hypothetical protein
VHGTTVNRMVLVSLFPMEKVNIYNRSNVLYEVLYIEGSLVVREV